MTATDTPEVTVVVPVYNGASTIADCVRSLIALEYPKERLEIVVVNNLSTDATVSILREFGDAIRLLDEPVRGPAAARNCGIRASRREVIALTDADCVVDRDWLRHIVSPLSDERVGVSGGRILSIRPCNAIEQFGEEIHDHEKAINVYRPPYVITMNWASRRAVLEEAGLFDKTLLRCEDVDLAYRITSGGYRLAYAPEAIVYHRNERTYGGLFAEGFAHGLHAVNAVKKHSAFLAGFGHRRFDSRSYLAIGSALREYAADQSSRALCSAVFNAGKKAGKIAGSVRFGHLDL